MLNGAGERVDDLPTLWETSAKEERPRRARAALVVHQHHHWFGGSYG
jgi:hypothetical protein